MHWGISSQLIMNVLVYTNKWRCAAKRETDVLKKGSFVLVEIS